MPFIVGFEENLVISMQSLWVRSEPGQYTLQLLGAGRVRALYFDSNIQRFVSILRYRRKAMNLARRDTENI